MNEFFANNWFSIFTVACIVGGTLLNLGGFRQRNQQTKTAVEELKQTMKDVELKFEKHVKDECDGIMSTVNANAVTMYGHINNTDAHVTSTLLELLKTRHEFTAQQLSDARNDIQRIEQMLARDK